MPSRLPLLSRHTSAPTGARLGSTGALPGGGGGCRHSDVRSAVLGAALSAPLLSPPALTASCAEPPRARGAGRHSPSVTALPLGRLPRSTAGPSRKIVSSPPETTLPLFSVCRFRVSCLFSTVGDEGTRRRDPAVTARDKDGSTARLPPGTSPPGPPAGPGPPHTPAGQRARSPRGQSSPRALQRWPHTYPQPAGPSGDSHTAPLPALRPLAAGPGPQPLTRGCSLPGALPGAQPRPQPLTPPGPGPQGRQAEDLTGLTQRIRREGSCTGSTGGYPGHKASWQLRAEAPKTLAQARIRFLFFQPRKPS